MQCYYHCTIIIWK